MSWATLFERAADRETSLDDVRAALARRRETRAENTDAAHDGNEVGNEVENQ